MMTDNLYYQNMTGDLYYHRFWGWDDGSVLFIREVDQDVLGDGPHVHRLQDYPELMRAILQLCEEYFSAVEPDTSPPAEQEQR
jgi:hypothetical protein